MANAGQPAYAPYRERVVQSVVTVRNVRHDLVRLLAAGVLTSAEADKVSRAVDCAEGVLANLQCVTGGVPDGL